MSIWLLSLLACDAPTCDAGGHADAEGGCVADTGNAAPGDTGDSDTPTDSGETGHPPDTGDTGETPDTGEAELEVLTFDVSAHVAATDTWYGLSAGIDGVVWAATSVGLLALEPGTGAARSYGMGEGLAYSSARAVLAHTDGTLWVGYSGTDAQQGDHFGIDAGGNLSRIEIVDFTESTEITQVHRMREQPYGAGVGDVWMGTNEGLCVHDASLGVFAEHAHPDHPHLDAGGVTFTPDDHIWNGDEYQVSRWNYSDDGDLSPSADLVEFWTPWPVQAAVEPVEIVDADAIGEQVWLASKLYGIARIDVGALAGTSVTELYAAPATALAVRAQDGNTVFVGTESGLWVLDVATDTLVDKSAVAPFDQPVSQLARDTSGPWDAIWLALPGTLVRVTGVP